MTRSLMPAAISFALALVGLPAAAAEIGDEDQATAEVQSDAAAAPAAAPEVDEAQAQRRGKARAGSKTRARSGGQKGARSGGQPAARSNQGQGRGAVSSPSNNPRSQAAPQAAGDAARHALQRAPQTSQRASASAPRAATNPRSPSALSGRLSSPARPSSGDQSRATNARSQGRDQGQNSGAQRPDGAQRPGNSPRPDNVHSRPGRGSTSARPGSRPANRQRRNARQHVVHHPAGVPMRWAPSWHRYHLRGVSHYSPRYWAAGIFIYSPPPRAHRVVVVDGAGHRIKDAPAPSRAVDRNNSFSVGLRGGSYLSGYSDGASYGDLGLGLSLSYRPVEAIGLDLTWMHHSDSWDEYTERAQDPISASVELFAFPWTRVSPYALVGLTATPRAADDTYFNGMEEVHYQANDALFGPHAGLGIEFAVGQSASLSFDGRYIGYVDKHEGDRAVPGALQGQMGLNFYF